MGQVVKRRKNWDGEFIEKFWIVGIDGEVREWTVELETMEGRAWRSEHWLFKDGSREWRFGIKDWSYEGAVEEVEGRM